MSKQYSGKGILFDAGHPFMYTPGFTIADLEAFMAKAKASVPRDIVGELMSAAQYVRQMPEEKNG